MKKIISIICVIALLISIVGCAGQNRRTQGAGAGAAIGGIIGALSTQSNSWVGLVIGATAGAVLGMLVGDAIEQEEQAKIKAAQSQQTVVVYDKKDQAVKSEPYGQSTVSYNNNMKTECQKVRTTIWKDGKQVSEEINEVCTSTKVSNTY